ncbi:MAG: sigma-54-dependent transcriptional regulator [Desulfatirhabdiaceae bacterium]
MFPTIMIVDDERSIVRSLSGLLSDEGYEVITAGNGYEALKKIETESPDLVLLDIWMPGLDGIETLKEIKKNNPLIQVIIITGHGNIETAIKAIKLGAFDLIEKPLSIEKVIVSIHRALNFQKLEEENRYLRKKMMEKHAITGNSPAVTIIRKQIWVAAPTDAWILITGENGTGKELIARTIHQLSTRAEDPMIAVNCAAIPNDLFESELFGHEKGAFTGATAKKRGKMELAGKGTLFLDEIADMSVTNQGKLLRVLQEKQFQRVGGTRTMTLDARIIAATNRDIEQEIIRGTFREDLYFRLNVIPVEVPPLRNRRQDIPMLVEQFLAESARQNQGRKIFLSAPAMDAICAYSWPGNVRELKNLLERLTIMAEKDQIDLADIPMPYNPDLVRQASCHRLDAMFEMERMKDAQKAFESEFIRRKLAIFDQDVERTAESIAVSQTYLTQLINSEE